MEDPSDTSRGFDFQIGTWDVDHRRLKVRLSDCDDWDEFPGTCDMRPILGGSGNIEDNVLRLPGGTYRAVALRSFDLAQRTWAIWWLDARWPHQLDVPVVGRFDNGVGEFHAEDTLGGAPVRIRFLWLRTETQCPRWEQAMSRDDGQTWETNWTMDFRRRL